VGPELMPTRTRNAEIRARMPTHRADSCCYLRGLVTGPSRVAACDRRIVRRMPRLQVYLPDDLYEQVKSRHLPASELLQAAVRAEVRRQDLLVETDAYLADLIAEVGEPTAKDVARAEAIAREIATRRAVHAG
jgi:post-segregation antitoxin (ccd killing protein)